jgi:hypothetical protein
MPRRDFSRFVYQNLFRRETPAARASLSRAYQRLEERGLLIRAKGCWRLTESQLDRHEF